MTIVVRKIASSPERTSAETWNTIVKLLAPSEDKWASELNAITGCMSSIIASKILINSPIIIRGNGPLLRIYCLYDDDAVIGEDKKEQALNWEPISGDWKMYAPCPENLLDQMKNFISKRVTRIELHSDKEDPSFNDNSVTKSASFTIDLDAMRNS